MKKPYRKEKGPKDFALKVYVHGNTEKDLNDALRRFSKRVDRSNIMDDLKRKRRYQKPSLKKHSQKN